MVKKLRNRNGILSECFGKTARVRIIEFFAVTKELDHSLGNMISYLELSKATGYKIVKDLKREGILKKTRKVSNTQLYQLNLDNEKGKLLGDLFHYAVEKWHEKKGA
jgi:hypothetical protein